jgi:hypothetical protein
MEERKYKDWVRHFEHFTTTLGEIEKDRGMISLLSMSARTNCRWEGLEDPKPDQRILICISVGKYRGMGENEDYQVWRSGVRRQIKARRDELLIPEGLTPKHKDRFIRGAILLNKVYDPDFGICVGMDTCETLTDTKSTEVLDDICLKEFYYDALRHEKPIEEAPKRYKRKKKKSKKKERSYA